MWATTQDGITQLRELMGDGTTDKYVYRKKCLGTADGTNVSFKTLERRRTTNFSSSTSPFGVFVNGAPVSVATDDLPTGEFSLSVAPTIRQDVEATYYYQWFLDSELDQFLQNAAQWLGFSTVYINVVDGLIPSALHYAGQEAYHRLANWWQVRLAETYRLEDIPSDKDDKSINAWMQLAKAFQDKALRLRNDYYTRQGQNLQPLFGAQFGHVRDYTPKR